VSCDPACSKSNFCSATCAGSETASHDTADPEIIVVEYELAGTVTATGHRASAPFIGVLRARDGRIAGWREYQDKIAIAQNAPRLRAGDGPSPSSSLYRPLCWQQIALARAGLLPHC
jgi:hypothetical protein